MSGERERHRCAYRVVTHDSWRGDGRPVAVFSGDERFDIVQIEKSWISTGVETTSPVRRCFEVRCRGGALTAPALHRTALQYVKITWMTSSGWRSSNS